VVNADKVVTRGIEFDLTYLLATHCLSVLYLFSHFKNVVTAEFHPYLHIQSRQLLPITPIRPKNRYSGVPWLYKETYP
jgi:hypothetical protein